MNELANAIKELGKKGIEVAVVNKFSRNSNVGRYSTGLTSLDYILDGGFPKGRLVEIYGMESTGKSLLSLIAIAAVQKQGGKAFLVDAEHGYDKVWATKMGVNSDELLIAQTDTGEQALTAIEKVILTNEVQLIVVDSMAAMIPKVECEGEIGDVTIGLQARMMSQGLRKINSALTKSDTTVVFINQLRMKIGVLYGDPTVTPGGLALKFYASLRMSTKKYAKDKIIDSSKVVIGHGITVDVVKSKISQPYLKAKFDMYFSGGFDTDKDFFDTAIMANVVTKDGNTYFVGKDKLAVGEDKSFEVVTTTPKIKDNIQKEIQAIIDSKRNVRESVEVVGAIKE